MATLVEYLLFFGINLSVIALVVLLYYRSYRNRRPNRNKVIVLVMAGALVYVVIDQMLRVEIGLGVGFGIFAIFSLLRFRTVPISLRDMTYLFTVVTFSLVNAMLLNSDDLTTMLAVDLALMATLALLEWERLRSGPGSGRERSPDSARSDSIGLEYDNLRLLGREQRQALLEDLRERTGLEPERVLVERIDLQAGSASLRLYFPVSEEKQEEGNRS